MGKNLLSASLEFSSYQLGKSSASHLKRLNQFKSKLLLYLTAWRHHAASRSRQLSVVVGSDRFAPTAGGRSRVQPNCLQKRVFLNELRRHKRG